MKKRCVATCDLGPLIITSSNSSNFESFSYIHRVNSWFLSYYIVTSKTKKKNMNNIQCTNHDKFSVFQPKSFLSKTIFLDLQKQKKKWKSSIREREGGKIDQGTRFAEKFCHFVESDRFLERTFHWLSPSLKPKRAFSTVDWIAQKKQIENLLLTFLLFYSSIRFMSL